MRSKLDVWESACPAGRARGVRAGCERFAGCGSMNCGMVGVAVPPRKECCCESRGGGRSGGGPGNVLLPEKSPGGVALGLRTDPTRVSSAGLCDSRLVLVLGSRLDVIPWLRIEYLPPPPLLDADPPKRLLFEITSAGLLSNTVLSYFG